MQKPKRAGGDARPTQLAGDHGGDVGSNCSRSRPAWLNTIWPSGLVGSRNPRSLIRLRSRPLSVACCAVPSLPCCMKILDAAEKCVTASHRSAVCRVMLFLMMKQPAPISLRIRSAEATYRARKLLHRLAEEDRLQ